MQTDITENVELNTPTAVLGALIRRSRCPLCRRRKQGGACAIMMDHTVHVLVRQAQPSRSRGTMLSRSKA